MGCARSTKCAKAKSFSTIPSLCGENIFTPQQEAILRDTWALFEAEKAAMGIEILRQLVNTQRQLEKFFKKMTDAQNERLELSLLSNHGQYIADVFPLVIENIGSLEANKVHEKLINFGKNHHKMGISPGQLSFLWPILRDMLKDRLEDKMDQSTELAWKRLFEYLHHHMSHGIHIAICEECCRCD